MALQISLKFQISAKQQKLVYSEYLEQEIWVKLGSVIAAEVSGKICKCLTKHMFYIPFVVVEW